MTSFGSNVLTEEFTYSFGDPRPHLLNYLLKMDSYMLGTIPTKSAFKPFEFKCNESNKRDFLPPSNLKKVLQRLSKPDETRPIILIPVLHHNRTLCKQKHRSKHLSIILYNTVTDEVERIDMRKFHMDGYSIKKYALSLEKFIEEYIPSDTATLNEELDVPLPFLNKHKFKAPEDAFPLFLIAYLHVRSEDPSLEQGQVIKEVKKMTTKTIKDLWSKYAQYRETTDNPKCASDSAYNAESARCMKLKTMKPLLMVEPIAECKKGLVAHPLTNKCVKQETIKDVDILDKWLTYGKAGDALPINVANMSIIFKVTSYVIGMFPHAKFLHSPNPGKDRQDTSILWEYDGNKFNLSYPDKMWQVWKQYMDDSRVKFIIILISGASFYTTKDQQGRHANVVIYDKDSNEMERFDSLGADASPAYRFLDLDKLLERDFNAHMDKPIKYLAPMDYCPLIPIFQLVELNDIPLVGDTHGNCAVWRLWYIHLRLSNPHLDRTELIELANAKIKKSKRGFYTFIKAYQRYVLNMASKA